MKIISGECVKIMGLRSFDGGLLISGDPTVENARETIDETNKLMIEGGHISEPKKYLIARITWSRVEEDDGTFHSSKGEVHVIEKYPAD